MRAMVVGWIVVGVLFPGTAWASASCAPSTDRTRYALADVVFDGVAHGGEAGVPGGAATFTVRQWHKGPGDAAPAALTVSGQAVDARHGEVWRIYATTDRLGALTASRCSGTGPLASLTEPPPFAGPGLGFTGALAVTTAGLGLRRRKRSRWLSPLGAPLRHAAGRGQGLQEA